MQSAHAERRSSPAQHLCPCGLVPAPVTLTTVQRWNQANFFSQLAPTVTPNPPPHPTHTRTHAHPRSCQTRVFLISDVMLPSIVHKQSLQDCNSFRNFFFFLFWKTCSKKKKNPNKAPINRWRSFFTLLLRASSDTDFLSLCKTMTVMFDSRFQWTALVETVQPLRWLVGFGIRLQREQCCSNYWHILRLQSLTKTHLAQHFNTNSPLRASIVVNYSFIFHISAVIDWRAVHLLPPCTVKAYVLV